MVDKDAFWEESNRSLLVFFGVCCVGESLFVALKEVSHKQSR